MLIVTRTLQPWQGEIIDGVRYPANVEQLWSDADLAAIGLSKFQPFVPPDGQVAVGPSTYQMQNGLVVEVRATEDAPAPVETIDERVADLEATQAATQAALVDKGVITTDDIDAQAKAPMIATKVVKTTQ